MSSPRALGLSELNLRYAYLEERQTRLLRELEEIREVKKQLDAERATYAPVYLVPDDVLYQILDEAFAWSVPFFPNPSPKRPCHAETRPGISTSTFVGATSS